MVFGHVRGNITFYGLVRSFQRALSRFPHRRSGAAGAAKWFALMSSEFPRRIVYLTAGAGGMYCGSCMHDNQLARAMLALGTEVTLVPLYMPIRTDVPAATVPRVFFGGVNVYLQQRLALARHLPPMMTRWLDHPRLLRWLGARQQLPDAELLGQLTLSMLQGVDGRQRQEVYRLASWLKQQPRPDLLLLTNALIAGCAGTLKAELNCPVVVLLQGDDIFLDGLEQTYRQQAIEAIQQLAQQIDGFLVHSQFYADYMASYLRIAPRRIRCVPLGIELAGFPRDVPGPPVDRSADRTRRTIGYLARLAPEKGLHVLVDALLKMDNRVGDRSLHLNIAGWRGAPNEAYAQQQFDRLRQSHWRDSFAYAGSIDRDAKIRFLADLDVLSVPTTYRDPKGLFVLEALAAGVPVVQPAHGAFPELIQSTSGGVLFTPGDSTQLAERLQTLLLNDPQRAAFARAGHAAVHDHHAMTAVAQQTLNVIADLLEPSRAAIS